MKFKLGPWVVGDMYKKKSHKAYYCVVTHPDKRREERRLGEDKNGAEGRRAEIIAAIRREGVPSLDSLVRDLVFQFLDYSKANNSHKTYLGYKTYLESFCKSLQPASLRVRDLLPAQVDMWLTKRYPAKTTNTNTRHDAVVAVKRVFNWAMKQLGCIERNPVAGYPTPPNMPRKTLLFPEQWAKVLSFYPPEDPFHDFLRVMICTGARPQEVRVMEARHINWQRQAAYFTTGEIPGKASRPRTLRLPSDVVAILRKWALEVPGRPRAAETRTETPGRPTPWSRGSAACKRRSKASAPTPTSPATRLRPCFARRGTPMSAK